MTSQWVMDEMQSADLRDKRLERRLIQLIDTLSEASTAHSNNVLVKRIVMRGSWMFPCTLGKSR